MYTKVVNCERKQCNSAVYGALCGKKEIGLLIKIMKEMALKSKCAQLGPDHFLALLLQDKTNVSPAATDQGIFKFELLCSIARDCSQTPS